MVPDTVQNFLPDSCVWHRACKGYSSYHGREDGKEVRCFLFYVFPGHKWQDLLTKFQDCCGAAPFHCWPCAGNIRGKGSNGATVIKMIATFQRQIAPYHSFPAFAGFGILRRTDKLVT